MPLRCSQASSNRPNRAAMWPSRCCDTTSAAPSWRLYPAEALTASGADFHAPRHAANDLVAEPEEVDLDRDRAVVLVAGLVLDRHDPAHVAAAGAAHRAGSALRRADHEFAARVHVARGGVEIVRDRRLVV